MIMHRLFVCAALLALLALAAACKSDEPPPSGTTLTQTLGVDSEGNLVVAEGEPYTVRTELAQAQSDRRDRRLSLVVFHQLSDFGIVDEESPLRSEWLEACNSAVNDESFRSQESLSLHVAEALIAQANVVDRSPVTRAPVDFAIHTGSAADNAQFNELRWFIDLMDGVPVDPESGAVGYEGVQTESPAKAYADLLTLAQEAFIPEGINYPWYAVAGNHDALSQGNFPLTERAAEVATGAQKIFALGPAALAEVCDSGSIFGPGPSAELLNDPGTIIRGVGADKNRRLISHSDWIREHLPPPNTGPGPLGHGFSIQGANEGRAYYTFEENGVVFIVLDSANPSGFPSGSLDQAQYDWLEERLTAHSSSYADGGGQFVTTENADRLMVIVSHHPSAVMTNPYPGTDGEPRTLRGEVEDLVGRFPNVVLWLSGHTGRNSISARPAAAGGGYWEVTTAGALDFPMQGRLLEIVDNRDGTLSIFTTMYGLATTVNPGDAEDGTPEDGLNQRLLAGVARQLAFRDPQLDPAGPGLSLSDRNAELLVPAPFDLFELPPPTESR